MNKIKSVGREGADLQECLVHDCGVPGAGIEAPHIVAHLHLGPELLLQAVGGVRKVDNAVARDHHIVGTVELQTLEVVQQLPRSSAHNIQDKESPTCVVAALCRHPAQPSGPSISSEYLFSEIAASDAL